MTASRVGSASALAAAAQAFSAGGRELGASGLGLGQVQAEQVAGLAVGRHGTDRTNVRMNVRMARGERSETSTVER